MTVHNDHYYKSMAVIAGKAALSGDATGRAVMPMGQTWQRFNPGEELIWLDDAEGKPRALTPRQYRVLTLALEMIEGEFLTMRAMAQRLQVAPSTVSRALTKLASWGLIAYVVGRGRWAGLVIFRRAKGDGLERFRDAAKARVRRWSEAAQRRISRLEINVASYFLGRERVSNDTLYPYLESLVTKDATLTTQLPWTAQELREAGII